MFSPCKKRLSMLTTSFTIRFHVTHYGGCAVLFNKDTFFPGLLEVMSLHINNSYAKKRSIGKKLILTIREVMLDEKVDMVAGDFSGAAWRRDNSNSISISIIEEAFADCALPMPPGPHYCGDRGRFRVRGQTCVDSSKPRIQMENGKFPSTAHSHSSRSSGHPPDRSELPSRGMAPSEFC